MKKNKIASIIVAVAIFTILWITGILDFRVSTGFSSVNTSAEWRVSFKFLLGYTKGIITVNQDDSYIIIKNDIEKGKVKYRITHKGDHAPVSELDSTNSIDTIRIHSEGIYRIRVSGQCASGQFSIVSK